MQARLSFRPIVTVLCTALLTLSGVSTAAALGTETTIVLLPHCIGGYSEDNTMLKEDPEATQSCPTFTVEDPQTLRTPALAVGDILDIDIVVENPDAATIERVRAWLAYDPNILQGDTIEVSEEFPAVTPGEADFSEAQGYAMIDAAAEGNGPEDPLVFVARVQFSVRKATPSGTVISFYDVQKDGHTTVVGEGEDEPELLTQEPGVLRIVFGEGTGASVASTPSSTAATSQAAGLVSDGDACITNTQCRSGVCGAGICQPAGSKVANGGGCASDSECVSNRCIQNICQATATASSAPAAAASSARAAACTADSECNGGTCAAGVCIPPPSSGGSASVPVNQEQRTAFALLQVQGLGITTDDNAIFIGWEPLNSSQLKAYNVYYGTTTGRYIQRKTVESTVRSLAIRGLPNGSTYYVAVRAVNLLDEESAFSQEVAVTVGEPSTSTAPIAANLLPGTSTTGKSPIAKGGSVPGATGSSSVFIVLAVLSAVIGTAFAARRQSIALLTRP